MTNKFVYDLLNELGGKATIDALFNLAKTKTDDRNVAHRLKIRDSLIRLSKKGIVASEGDTWKIVKAASAEELGR